MALMVKRFLYVFTFYWDPLHLLENTFDRKRISVNPSLNPNYN